MTRKRDISQLIELREKGFSYRKIGGLVSLSGQRVHQLLTGYGYKRSDNLYQFLRNMVLQRDSSKCIRCGSKENIEVHHLDGDSNNSQLNNMATLCITCHHNLTDLQK